MFLTAHICALLSGVFGIYLNLVWKYGQEKGKCLTSLRDVTMQTSVAYCVGFTVYRYLVVCRPMSRIDWSGPRRATLFCSATLLFVVARDMYCRHTQRALWRTQLQSLPPQRTYLDRRSPRCRRTHLSRLRLQCPHDSLTRGSTLMKIYHGITWCTMVFRYITWYITW